MKIYDALAKYGKVCLPDWADWSKKHYLEWSVSDLNLQDQNGSVCHVCRKYAESDEWQEYVELVLPGVKKCPICGADPEYRHLEDGELVMRCYLEDDHNLEAKGTYVTINDAIDGWNNMVDRIVTNVQKTATSAVSEDKSDDKDLNKMSDADLLKLAANELERYFVFGGDDGQCVFGMSAAHRELFIGLLRQFAEFKS